MPRRYLLLFFVCTALFLWACARSPSMSTATRVPLTTSAIMPTLTSTTSTVPMPAPPTVVASPSAGWVLASPSPASTSTQAALTGYLDDRSSPEAVLRSYTNAVNRHEYLRAYSYWDPAAAATHLPAYDAFAQGYIDTLHLDVSFGTVRTGAGAGQLYFAVPVVLDATQRDGSHRLFAGCYLLHLAQPAIQQTPPFRPLAIVDATIQAISPGTGALDVAGQQCPGV